LSSKGNQVKSKLQIAKCKLLHFAIFVLDIALHISAFFFEQSNIRSTPALSLPFDKTVFNFPIRKRVSFSAIDVVFDRWIKIYWQKLVKLIETKLIWRFDFKIL